MEPSSFAAVGDRLPVHLNSAAHVLEIPGQPQKSSNVAAEEPDQVERDTTSQKKEEAETLEFEAWPDFRNFRIWRMNFTTAVSSCARRPIEADFKGRVFIHEEAAQKEKRFLTGRQVAWMICEFFQGQRHRRILLGPQ